MDITAALDQLAGGAPGGAGRLRAMISAEIYTVGDAVRISFRGCRDWNSLEIALSSTDTYRMVFYHTRKGTHQDVDGIYADQLADTFRSVTGLDTHL